MVEDFLGVVVRSEDQVDLVVELVITQLHPFLEDLGLKEIQVVLVVLEVPQIRVVLVEWVVVEEVLVVLEQMPAPPAVKLVMVA
jgi:hypothetical protein